MRELPAVDGKQIRAAIMLGQFRQGDRFDCAAFAGCNGHPWMWYPTNVDSEVVVADCDEGGGVAIQVHGPDASWAYCPIRDIFTRL